MSKQTESYSWGFLRSIIQPALDVCAITLIIILSGCAQYETIPVSSIHSRTTAISLESATNDLINLIQDIESHGTRDGMSQPRKIGTAYTLSSQAKTRSDSTAPLAYIINFENNQGYAIMSADERMPSLLCFVENGNLSPNDTIQNPGELIFLQGLDDYCQRKIKGFEDIERLDFKIAPHPEEMFDTGPYVTYGPWENTVYKVGGYCPVKWGQRTPYNDYCPIKKGERTLAGCVAVAVGQLMATHKFPSFSNGYSYDWDAMTSSKWAYYISDDAQHQISRLMQQLGKKNNLNMDYGRKSSGAKFQHSMRTLSNFGYANPGELIKYDISEITVDLKAGYPVLCSGFSHKTKFEIIDITIASWLEKGHAWLLHGLLERKRSFTLYNSDGSVAGSGIDTTYYPLCNWGWNGDKDGYYLSNVFDACNGPDYGDYTRSNDNICEGDTAYYYRHGVEVIKGIRK